MAVKVTITSLFNCSLERAFKTPLLCDITLIHTGYFISPKVTHTTDDDNWGQPGSSKKIFSAPAFLQKGGFTSVDTILQRVENHYWQFEVGQFQNPTLGFTHFTGEWTCTEVEKDKVRIIYTYTLHSRKRWLFPVQWIFAKTFWRIYMQRVLRKVKMLAYAGSPYLYP